MKNTTIKNLLTIDRNALKALHDVMQLDYNKPFTAFQIDGRFTVNRIEKQAAAEGYNPTNATIIVITTGGNMKWRGEKLNVITLTGSGSFDIDYKFYSTQKTKCDHYITKGDFNEHRKEENITAFVICQKKSDLAPVNDHKPDFENRFKVKNVTRWSYSNHAGSYIGDVTLIRTDDTGSIYTYNKQGNVYYRGSRPEYESIDQIIDKSGYIVADKRRNLLSRANALRVERAKVAYQASNNAAQLATLAEKIEAKKAAIIDALKNATTGKEVNEIGKKIYFYGGLATIIEKFEYLKEKDNKKAYSSIDSFAESYKDIENKLAEI